MQFDLVKLGHDQLAPMLILIGPFGFGPVLLELLQDLLFVLDGFVDAGFQLDLFGLLSAVAGFQMEPLFQRLVSCFKYLCFLGGGSVAGKDLEGRWWSGRELKMVPTMLGDVLFGL